MTTVPNSPRHDVRGGTVVSGVCSECREGIHLETAGSDMGVLEGASVWVHDRFYPFGLEPHEPTPLEAARDSS
jgi:hypothetical protein